MKTKDQYICVMSRHYTAKEWGICKAWNVSVLGIYEATKRANEFMAEQESLWSRINFKLEGREW